MRLFISYAHVDRVQVEELQKLFTKAGNEVWFDNELAGSENWWMRILGEIEQCDVFIFALSPHSTNSSACRSEFQYALELNKPVLPVMLKDAELPIGRLQETQYIDARRLKSNDTVLALTKSLLTLQKQISSNQYPLPNPLPPRPEFPFAADPLKEIREKVKNLGNTSEEEIVAIVYRIKQLARLSNSTSRESRQILQSIMTDQRVPHSVALEARDALTALPADSRPRWIYGAGLAALVVIAAVIFLINSNQKPSQIEPTQVGTTQAAVAPTNTIFVTDAPTSMTVSTATPVVSSTPLFTLTPTEKSIPTSIAGQISITIANASQITQINAIGRGLPTRMTESPDGKTIAVSTNGGSVWLVDAQNPLSDPRELKGHTQWVEPVAFSADSKLLASGSSDTTIRLWDVATGAQLSIINGYKGWVRALVFSQDGKTLYSGGCWDLRAWNVADPKNPLQIGDPISIEGLCINALAINPASEILAVSYDLGKISLLNFENRKQYILPAGHTSYVLTLAFSPDGKFLASGSIDNSVRFWDVTSLQSVGVPLIPDKSYVNSIAFTPNGQQLVIGTNNKSIFIWDIKDKENPSQIGDALKGHRFEVIGVAVNPDGSQVASVSRDGTLRFSNILEHKQIGEPYNLFTTWVRNGNSSLDSQYGAVGYSDGSVWVLNIASGIKVKIGQHSDTGNVTTLFSPVDKNLLVSRGGDNKILLWNLANSGKEPISLERKNSVDAGCSCRNTLAFSPDGVTLAAAFGGDDQSIHFWDVSNSSNHTDLDGTLKGTQKDIVSLAFSPDGTLIASGGEDKTITIWDRLSRTSQCSFLGHTDAIRSILFSTDGKYLFSGSDDNAIRIWDISKCQGEVTKPIIQLTDQSAPIKSLAISPDGTILAAGAGTKNNIWLWDIRNLNSPKFLKELPETASVYSLSFSNDGTLLMSGGDSGVVRFWGIPKSE